MYSIPSDDDVIQSMDDSEIKVADLKSSVNDSIEQRNKHLLEGLSNELDVIKSKQHESSHALCLCCLVLRTSNSNTKKLKTLHQESS